jgi:hypothetical protein
VARRLSRLVRAREPLEGSGINRSEPHACTLERGR